MSRPTTSRIACDTFPSHHIITGIAHLIRANRSSSIIVKIQIQINTKVPFSEFLIGLSKRIGIHQ
jgi:hypothetical protein